MKGVVIERAKPSNVLDIYALFKSSVKDGVWAAQTPNQEETKNYYFKILEESMLPTEFIFLARRGKAYWGYLQAQLCPGPWGRKPVMFIKMLYVVPKKRKLGIGKKLIGHLKNSCSQMGIDSIELMCQDENVEYYKKHGGEKRVNLISMGVG